MRSNQQLLIGLFDDITNISPYLRLALQFFLTLILFSLGLNIDGFDVSWLNLGLSPLIINKFLSLIFVSFWVVGLTNAINWLDGLDSLASGISLITLLTLGCIFIFFNKWDLVFISLALCGGILGFLRYNFFPAKIMMGDCGSYFLGSSLSILSLLGMSVETNNQSIQSLLQIESLKIFPIHLAIILFFVPLFDMTYVILMRIIRGYSPFYPDKNHIHHKILRKGINERSTAIILFATSVFFGCSTLYISGINGKVYLICFSLIFIQISILYVLNMKVFLDKNYQNQNDLRNKH